MKRVVYYHLLALFVFLSQGSPIAVSNLEPHRVHLDGVKRPSFAGTISLPLRVSEGNTGVKERGLFYWYFPPAVPLEDEEAPLMIWLQGGPGASSMTTLFHGHGPLRLAGNVTEQNDPLPHWHHLYLDQPVGSGLSYALQETPLTRDEVVRSVTADYPHHYHRGYAVTQTAIAQDLTDMMDRLLVLYPTLQGKEIIFAGESFAARTISHTTAYWRQHRPEWVVRLLVLNSPSIDMRLQTPAFLELIKAHHLVSQPALGRLATLFANQVAALDQHDVASALDERVLMLDAFRAWSGNTNMWDLRMGGVPYRFSDVKVWCNAHLVDLHVRKGVHFTDASRENLVFAHLRLDMMCSALPALQSVTHHTPVLIVSGSHDVRSGPASVEALNLTNPDTRHTWVAQHGGKHTIGSVQYGRHTNITHVTCLNAGHMITLKSAFFHCLRFTVCEELNAEQRNCSMGRSNT